MHDEPGVSEPSLIFHPAPVGIEYFLQAFKLVNSRCDSMYAYCLLYVALCLPQQATVIVERCFTNLHKH